MTTISAHKSKKVGGRKRRLAIILIAFTALMGGAIGFAAWTTSGTGNSGTVTAGSEIPLVILGTTPATGLTPGSTQNSSYTIQNLNTYSVTVVSIVANSIAVTGGTGVPAACTAANDAVTATTGTGTVSITIPALSTSATQTVTLAMGTGSANGCQLAVFTPNITAS